MAVIASENYRSTLGFVTDVSPEVHIDSAGWTGATGHSNGSVIDRRLSGIVYKANSGTQATRTITLPSAGDYVVRLALGFVSAGEAYQYLQVRDNTTPVLTIDKSSGTAGAHWYDATGTDRDETTWPATYAASGAPLTFATTSLVLALGTPGAETDASTIAHFSVESVAGDAGGWRSHLGFWLGGFAGLASVGGFQASFAVGSNRVLGPGSLTR